MRLGKVVLTITTLLFLNWSPIEGAIYHTVDFSTHHNSRMQDYPDGPASEFPEGTVTLGGIPFVIPEDANNVWNAVNFTGPQPRVLTASPGIASATTVYLLINTWWGSTNEGLASLEFEGSEGASHTKSLVGGTDIRDYHHGDFTNTIDSVDTINVFAAEDSSGVVRLDMVIVHLPTEFSSQTLSDIRVIDTGGTFYSTHGVRQRLFVAGITVASHDPIPEPTSLLIWSAIALGGLGLAYRRRKRAV